MNKKTALLQKGKKILAFVLTVVLMNSGTCYGGIIQASAKNNETDDRCNAKTITAFGALDSDVKSQTMGIGGSEDDINFPDSLCVTIETIKEESANETTAEAIETDESTTEETSTGNQYSEETSDEKVSTETSDLGTDVFENIASAFSPMTVYAKETVSGNDAQSESEATEETQEETIENITWKLDKAKSVQDTFASGENLKGKDFYYTPVIPDEYKIADEAELPVIKVTIGEKKVWEKTQTVDGINITVSADNGVFPEDAVLKVQKITNSRDKAKIKNAVTKEVQSTDTGSSDRVEEMYAFDITILDTKGNELQPDNSKGEVHVTFSQIDTEKTEKEDNSLQAFHMDEELDHAENVEVQVDTKEDTVEVVAEHFSVYVLSYIITDTTKSNLSGDIIYFGNYTSGSTYEVPWYVLNSDTLSQTSVAAGTEVLPLLSKYTLGTSNYFTKPNTTGFYPDSNLQTAMNKLYNGTGKIFTDKEQGAIADTTLSKASIHSSITDDLSGQKLFPLSYSEVENIGCCTDKMKATTHEGCASAWWLRSSYDDSYVFIVFAGGTYDGRQYGRFTDDVRPACNLNLSSVLFSSAAVGGKSISVNGTLTKQASASAISDWKLTLKDIDRSGFAVTEAGTTMNARQGETKTVNYSGALTGTKEYVSAVITNDSDDILFYGKLEFATSGSDQTANITIPSSLAAGSYTLKIFNEQCNGDKRTDLSSDFKNIALIVTKAPSSDSNSGDSNDNSSSDSSSSTSESEYTYVEPLKWNYAKDNANSLCIITKQGKLCQAVFKNATPVCYTEAFSFNLMLKGADGLYKTSYDAKRGKFILYIPSKYQKKGRAFALIGVDKSGKARTFTDSDTSDTSITIEDLKDFTGYAFYLIYTDQAGTDNTAALAKKGHNSCDSTNVKEIQTK